MKTYVLSIFTFALCILWLPAKSTPLPTGLISTCKVPAAYRPPRAQLYYCIIGDQVSVAIGSNYTAVLKDMCLRGNVLPPTPPYDCLGVKQKDHTTDIYQFACCPYGTKKIVPGEKGLCTPDRKHDGVWTRVADAKGYARYACTLPGKR